MIDFFGSNHLACVNFEQCFGTRVIYLKQHIGDKYHPIKYSVKQNFSAIIINSLQTQHKNCVYSRLGLVAFKISNDTKKMSHCTRYYNDLALMIRNTFEKTVVAGIVRSSWKELKWCIQLKKYITTDSLNWIVGAWCAQIMPSSVYIL